MPAQRAPTTTTTFGTATNADCSAALVVREQLIQAETASRFGSLQASGPMRIPVALLTLMVATAAQAVQPVPVTIGEVPDLDACISLAVVEGESPAALRSGPGDSFPVLSTLKPGAQVHLCSGSSDGSWSGVVVVLDGTTDCQVSSPVPAPRAYEGPCASGWLPTSRLEIIAG